MCLKYLEHTRHLTILFIPSQILSLCLSSHDQSKLTVWFIIATYWAPILGQVFSSSLILATNLKVGVISPFHI